MRTHAKHHRSRLSSAQRELLHGVSQAQASLILSALRNSDDANNNSKQPQPERNLPTGPAPNPPQVATTTKRSLVREAADDLYHCQVRDPGNRDQPKSNFNPAPTDHCLGRSCVRHGVPKKFAIVKDRPIEHAFRCAGLRAATVAPEQVVSSSSGEPQTRRAPQCQ